MNPSRIAFGLLVSSSFLAACATSETKTVAAPAIQKSSADWNMLGYDVGSTYWNQGEKKITKKSVPNLEKAWEFDGQGSVTSTPVISGGKAYVVSQGVFAIDLATGNQLWVNPDLSGSSSLAMDNGVLYINDSTGTIRALKSEDGSEIWNHKEVDVPEVWGFASPIFTKDYILYAESTNEELALPAPVFKGFVAALHKDGSSAWNRPTVSGDEHGVTVWSTLSADESLGTVYAATGNNHQGPAGPNSNAFLSIPLKDGAEITWSKQIFANDMWWPGSTDPDADFGANPVVYDFDGKKLVAGGNKGGDFWVLDRKSGEVLKKRDFGTKGTSFKGGVFTAVAWDGKRLLTACNDAKSGASGSEVGDGAAVTAVLFALDPLTLEIQWERQVIGVVFGPITVANGVGFFGKDTTLQAFDTDTGDVLYEFQTEATIASAPAISNGYVVFGSGINWFGGTNGTKYYALKVP